MLMIQQENAEAHQVSKKKNGFSRKTREIAEIIFSTVSNNTESSVKAKRGTLKKTCTNSGNRVTDYSFPFCYFSDLAIVNGHFLIS